MVAATLNGWVQKQKAEYARRLQQQIESGERVIVGVNAFRREDEPPIESVFTIPPSFESDRIARLRKIRESRDRAAVARSLGQLEEVCRAGANTVDATLAAVKTYATLGEIYDVYRRVWGDVPREEILVSMSI